MSHRLSFSIFGLLGVFAVGCSDDMIPSTCVVEKFPIDGTPLTLLPDARLDRVGNGFVLIGSDGDRVHWASLGTNGLIGTEHFIPVSAGAGQTWFAVAGTNAPMDHLVVAYIPAAAAATGLVDLMTFSVGFDNTMPTLPVVVGQIPATARVDMRSGRGGMHAALTWGVPGTTNISGRILGGDGRAIGSDLMLGSVGNFDCLRFSPGKDDLTVGYVDRSATPPAPTFVGREITAAGTLQSEFRLPIGNQDPGCVELVPTNTGYGLAWHSQGIGTYFGVYDPQSAQFPSQLVLGDVRLPAPPNLGGLGWMGKQYALVFARDTGGEVWPIDALGHRKGTLPVFPSAVGHTGGLSTQPVDDAVYATYADYSYADPANRSVGIRFLMKISCP